MGKKKTSDKSAGGVRKKYFQSQQLQNWIFSITIVNEKVESVFLDLIFMAHTLICKHAKIRAKATPYDPQFADYFLKRKLRPKEQTKNKWTK